MNKIYRIIVILLLFSLLAPLISCHKNNDSQETEPETVTDDEPIEENKIGNPSAFGAQSDEESTLPTISIITDGGGMIMSKDYQGATVSVSGAVYDECNFESLTAQIKCRGNFTFSVEKKSYRIKFDEKINLFNQGRGPAKSWVLLAEHCDQSFLRNHLTFSLATLLDKIAYVSSSSFVHLEINGIPQGIYHLAEQHQVQENRVNINEDPEIVDTDYFIEWDAYAGDEGLEYGVYWFNCEGNNFLVKSSYMTPEKCGFLQQYFLKTSNALISGDRTNIEKYINIDSFVDMYILQETVKNIDVGWSSFFLVKSANGKISCTCPWDFDLSLGNDYRLDDGAYENLYVGNSEYALGHRRLDQGNEWFCYLMQNQWFVDIVIDRWNEVYPAMQELAISEIDRILTCFGDEIAGNFDIWQIFGRRVNEEPWQIVELDTYEKHVLYLRAWINNRFEWLKSYFENDDTKYQTTEYEENNGWWNPGWWDPGR